MTGDYEPMALVDALVYADAFQTDGADLAADPATTARALEALAAAIRGLPWPPT